MQKIQSFFLRVISGVGLIVFLFLTYYSWRYTVRLLPDENVLDVRDNAWITLLILSMICIVFWGSGKLAERFLRKGMLTLALVVALVMMVTAWIFVNDAATFAVMDQVQVYQAAIALAEGNGAILQAQPYYVAYSHQLFLADLIAAVFRLTGTTEEILIYHIQAVLVGMTAFAGFGVTRELFPNRKAELFALILPLIFFPMRVYASYFYGETLGVCASLYAIWFFLRMNRRDEKAGFILLYGALTALCVCLAVMARNALLIVWIAMCIIQILLVIKRRKVLPLLMIFAALTLYLGGMQLVGSSLEKRTGIRQEDGMPTILWVTMGFQENYRPGKGAGSYNYYNIELFEAMEYDGEAAAAYARQELQYRLKAWWKDPADMAEFMRAKLLNQWNEPTYGCMIMTDYRGESKEWVERLYEGGTAEWLFDFLKQYQAVTYLILLTGFWMLFKKRQEPTHYLIGLITIGGFLFSAIWEAKSRYIYPYVVIAIPFISGSVSVWCDTLERSFKKGVQWITKHSNK
ncbi:MAG: hypothetical protein J1E64_04575 [Acetatifactor sp.]|nr:hypothetical protein [Acetatifactor sp.]